MAGVFTQRNRETLSHELGREPSGGDLYAAHFLGARGAAQLIETAQQSPSRPAARDFPDAAAANRSIFFDGQRARARRRRGPQAPVRGPRRNRSRDGGSRFRARPAARLRHPGRAGLPRPFPDRHPSRTDLGRGRRSCGAAASATPPRCAPRRSASSRKPRPTRRPPAPFRRSPRSRNPFRSIFRFRL